MASACPLSRSETQPRQLVGILLDDLHAAIRRAAVDDPIFQVRVMLVEHRADGLFQESGLLIGRGNDADARKGHGGS
jgi:hypothetical protein